METTKKCTHCGRILPVAEFYRHKKSKDGLQPWCKDCVKEWNNRKEKAYAYRDIDVNKIDKLIEVGNRIAVALESLISANEKKEVAEQILESPELFTEEQQERPKNEPLSTRGFYELTNIRKSLKRRGITIFEKRMEKLGIKEQMVDGRTVITRPERDRLFESYNVPIYGRYNNVSR